MKAVFAFLLISMAASAGHAGSWFSGSDQALDKIEGRGLFRLALPIDSVSISFSRELPFASMSCNTSMNPNPDCNKTRTDLTVTIVRTDLALSHNCTLESTLANNDIKTGTFRTKEAGAYGAGNYDVVSSNGQVYLDDRQSTNVTPLFVALLKGSQTLAAKDQLEPGGYSETFGLKRGSYEGQVPEREAERLLKAIGSGNIDRGIDVLKNLANLCRKLDK